MRKVLLIEEMINNKVQNYFNKNLPSPKNIQIEKISQLNEFSEKEEQSLNKSNKSPSKEIMNYNEVTKKK